MCGKPAAATLAPPTLRASLVRFPAPLPCCSTPQRALAVFLLVVAIWRYVSLGSVASAAAMPLLMYLLWAPPLAPPLVITFGTLFATGLVIVKHRANLQRLLDGSEPRFAFSKSEDMSE
jgi:hypothetical protein